MTQIPVRLPGAVVFARVAGDVTLEGDRPHTRPEVVQTNLACRQKYFRSQSEEIFTRDLSPIPSQSARSRAFASAVESPTTLTACSVWEEMKFVLDTITSSTGPRSSPATGQFGP